MIDAFLSGGVIMWPLLVVAIAVVGLAGRAALRLTRLRSTPPIADTRAGLGAILVWGAMAGLMGLLGTVVGLVQMARFVQEAGEVASRLMWGGMGNALVSFAFGLLVFILAALSWLALDHWSARVLGAASGAD